MRNSWRTLIVLSAILIGPAIVQAAEPYREFLDGLRARQYFDFAMVYLDQLESSTNLPEEVKQIVPYEKAVTLLENVKHVGNPQTQNAMLDEALRNLNDFVQKAPRHSKVAEANTERARILLGKARVEVWQSRSPSNQETRGEFQQRARDFVTKAREIFQAANDGHKGIWESFPKFIDKTVDPKQWEARRQAEIKYIRAQLDLALCSYEESQTHDENSAEYKSLLTKASIEFEDIHQKYRSQVGGLYARMWQGKCFEEQDDIKKALGIYNELLGHPGTSEPMKRLQDQVRQFRLICLNHPDRKDYQLVIIEGNEWLDANRREQRTSTGLGIRWEVVLSQESLASDRANDLKDSDRERLLQQSLANARFINKYPGQYNDISMFKIRDLQVKLKGKDVDPQDFDTALGLARNKIKEVGAKNDAVLTAKTKEEKAKAAEDRQLHLDETIRILKLAMSYVTAQTATRDINQARYFLSYAYYLTRHSYESAILSEFIAMHYQKEEGTMALDAAYLAMAAYVQAYNDSPKDQKDVDMKYMVRVCNLITANWPESDRANDARMQMGRVYQQMNQPVQAAEWYSQIPAKAPQYAEAQSNAGQAFWTAYLEAAILPDEEKPPKEELQKWQDDAEKHLRNGIDKLTAQIPDGGKASDDLIAAKVSLAQIIISDAKYQEAVDLIIKEPHAVETAITVAKEEDRPKKGVKSADFASLAYQLLLRSYVGIQSLDKARATMAKLESVAEASGGGEAVTATYVQLGKKLEEELKTLKGLGDQQRVAQLRSSFETFLDDMFKRQNQTYGSLVWIAETYYGLATGSEGEQDQSQKYFNRAADTYQAIIDRAASDGDQFADDSRLSGVKLRLVNCRRQQGEYQQALDLAADILAKNPKTLDAQLEAAYVLQSWGTSGQGNSYEKLMDAINGTKVGAKDAPIWGWGEIAKRLQMLLMAGQADAKEKYADRYLEARYNLSNCRYEYGIAQSTTEKKKQILDTSKAEIVAFVSITAEIPDVWWDKFDKLYQNIQKDMGAAEVVKLERPEVIETTAEVAGDDETTVAVAKAVPAKGPTPQPPPPTGGWIWGVLGILVAVGAAVGFYFMIAGQDKKRRAAYANAPPAEMPRLRTEPTRPKARAPQARKPQPKGPEAAAAAAKKPAAAKPAPSKPTAQPKPKPSNPQ